MLQKTRKTTVLFLIWISVFSFTGCGIKRLSVDDLPRETTILRYANTHCPEPHTLVSTERIEGKSQIRYDFVTERGVEFSVYSSVSQGFLTSDTTRLSNTYMDAVRALYDDEIEQLLETTITDEGISLRKAGSYLYFTISSYDQLNSISQLSGKLDELWKTELSYFRHSLPLATITVTYVQRDVEEGQSAQRAEVGKIIIDGKQSAEDVLTELQDNYLTLYDAGEISSSEGIPKELITSA